jgi:chromosome segregation ATPase
MINFLRKKEDATSPATEEAPQEGGPGEAKPAASPAPAAKPQAAQATASLADNPEIVKLRTEIEKLKAGNEAFKEVRNSFSERFTQTSEQIGELRSMILEQSRALQEVELKAVKSSDMVASVQPEKLMTEVQKQEVKIEALKANLEGNESIMNRVMEEVSETRKKIEFFRGVEEIVKLSEEVKAELIEIKKIQGLINIQTDKVQTIYSEMRTRIQDLDAFKAETQDAKSSIEQNAKDVEFVKSKISNLVEKSELDKLVSKMQGYVNSLKELQKKTSFSKDIEQLKVIMEGIK